MGIHNICIRGEIRNITILLIRKKRLILSYLLVKRAFFLALKIVQMLILLAFDQ